MHEVSLDVTPVDTPHAAAVPLRDLTYEARRELQDARDRVRDDRRSLASHQEEASALNAQSNAAPSKIPLIRELIEADARVAAAASRAISDFPGSVAVMGVMFVVDVETGLGRIAHLQDDRASALQHYEVACEVLAQARAYSRIRSVDLTIYGIASRAVTAAAELGADRQQSIDAFLARVDANIVKPYASLMAERDLADAKAFGAVAMLRRALQRREDTDYLARLRNEAPRLHEELRPTDARAARRFQIELSAILTELDIVLGKRKRRGWEW